MLNVFDSLSIQPSTDKAINLNLAYSGLLQSKGGSPSDVSEEPVTYVKRKKAWRLSCDVCEAIEGSENEL